MMPLLKAEFRKLFTIRSTYIILTISFLLIGFLTFWVFGYKGESAGSKLLTEAAMTAAQVLAVFLAIIAVLLMTHEYRCNTIMYTLTSSNSRHKVLLSKLLIVTVFTTAVTIVGMLFAMLMAWLGTVVGDGRLGVQYVDAWDILWRSLFFTWAYAMVGLFVSVLVRHVVGAIVVLMIVPSHLSIK
jgi:ABC-type transport system involved in multi-copper enzyme maturation permease subunit